MIEFPFADIYNYMSYRYKGLSDGWADGAAHFLGPIGRRSRFRLRVPRGKHCMFGKRRQFQALPVEASFRSCRCGTCPASIRFGADGVWRGSTQALASSAFLWLHPHPHEGSGSFGFSEAAAGAG